MERAGFMTCTATSHQGAIKEPGASVLRTFQTDDCLAKGPCAWRLTWDLSVCYDAVPPGLFCQKDTPTIWGTNSYSVTPRPTQEKSFMNCIFNCLPLDPRILHAITSVRGKFLARRIKIHVICCQVTSLFTLIYSQETDVCPWTNRASSVASSGFTKNYLRMLRCLQSNVNVTPKLFCRPQTSALPAYSL